MPFILSLFTLFGMSVLNSDDMAESNTPQQKHVSYSCQSEIAQARQVHTEEVTNGNLEVLAPSYMESWMRSGTRALPVFGKSMKSASGSILWGEIRPFGTFA